jgi:hypothetical protein
MKAISIYSRSLSMVAILGAVVATGCATETSSDSEDGSETKSSDELAQSANQQAAFAFLVGKGLSNVQAAGVIGNLMQESSMNPGAVEPGGPGRGIAQWSVGGRWDRDANDNVVAFARENHESEFSLNTQLAFTWFELTSFPGDGLADLRAATTIPAAVAAFQDKFERCGQCDSSKRIQFAQDAFNTFGGGSGGGNSQACTVHSDHRLYCKNTPNVAMRATPNLGATIVNHLKTSFSFFECWGTGDRHAGGNTTWYKTIGDTNPSLGWVPAVDLATTSAFDSNPSASGLPHC